jgi:RNA polymerase sigma-70 factor (ECF subfamily)
MRRPDDKPSDFYTTVWVNVMKAGQDDPVLAKAGMEYLYQVYKRPIHKFVCRQYHCNDHEAEELTQGFFTHLIEKATVKRANRDKGKFRNFLLGALKLYRAGERDRMLAEKRGGKCQFTFLDETDAPQISGHEAPVPWLADKEFNRDWALALIERAREQYRAKYIKEGKSVLFSTMEPAVLREDVKDLYAQWAASLEMSQEAVEVAFHRLRRRFGAALRHEVAQTVSNQEDIEEELRGLIEAIAD